MFSLVGGLCVRVVLFFPRGGQSLILFRLARQYLLQALSSDSRIRFEPRYPRVALVLASASLSFSFEACASFPLFGIGSICTVCPA